MKSYHTLLWGFLMAFVALLPLSVSAQTDTSLSVTVTPPLFQLTIGPGEEWSSAIKIVNNNSYGVEYYTNPVDFEAQGEDGKSNLIPLINTDDPYARTHSLASWLEIHPGPIFIEGGRSKEVPFTVRVPEDAEPGGHYAALMVGTQPKDDGTQNLGLKISSYVTALIFTKISGDIVESGRVREFRTEKVWYDTPDAQFVLRFENTGNVHLKPIGDVLIENMWGKERGHLIINKENDFGNVLPSSTRKFTFGWSGDQSLFDIGRYSATVTLAFGDGGRQNTFATTYFWVIPKGPLAGTVGSIAIILSLLTWFIRRYIRHALDLERRHFEGMHQHVPRPTLHTFVEPLREGVVDLRNIGQKGAPARASLTEVVPVTANQSSFLRKYKLFFAFMLVIIGVGVFLAYYIADITQTGKDFDIKNIQIEDTVLQKDGGSE